jgi:hypothetical protein
MPEPKQVGHAVPPALATPSDAEQLQQGNLKVFGRLQVAPLIKFLPVATLAYTNSRTLLRIMFNAKMSERIYALFFGSRLHQLCYVCVIASFSALTLTALFRADLIWFALALLLSVFPVFLIMDLGLVAHGVLRMEFALYSVLGVSYLVVSAGGFRLLAFQDNWRQVS